MQQRTAGPGAQEWGHTMCRGTMTPGVTIREPDLGVNLHLSWPERKGTEGPRLEQDLPVFRVCNTRSYFLPKVDQVVGKDRRVSASRSVRKRIANSEEIEYKQQHQRSMMPQRKSGLQSRGGEAQFWVL